MSLADETQNQLTQNQMFQINMKNVVYFFKQNFYRSLC